MEMERATHTKDVSRLRREQIEEGGSAYEIRDVVRFFSSTVCVRLPKVVSTLSPTHVGYVFEQAMECGANEQMPVCGMCARGICVRSDATPSLVLTFVR